MPEKSSAHRRQGLVHNVYERTFRVAAVGVEKFEIAYGEFVHPYVLVLLDARYFGYVPDRFVFGEFEIV